MQKKANMNNGFSENKNKYLEIKTNKYAQI